MFLRASGVWRLMVPPREWLLADYDVLEKGVWVVVVGDVRVPRVGVPASG
jgi:hypothetical protein